MQKIFLSSVGEVIIRKSSRAKRIILKINHEGKPVATIPKYIPYVAAQSFIKRHEDWLKEHMKPHDDSFLNNGQRIGKNHILSFQVRDIEKPRSRISKEHIVVSIPEPLTIEADSVQTVAKKAASRAIRQEAEGYLPQRLHQLAVQHGHTYKSVSVKNMRSRWGSCSNFGTIALNQWLIQLPDYLIDYVCIHELAHLKNPHHQTAFWRSVEVMMPEYKKCRAELKTMNPRLQV